MKYVSVCFPKMSINSFLIIDGKVRYLRLTLFDKIEMPPHIYDKATQFN